MVHFNQSIHYPPPVLDLTEMLRLCPNEPVGNLYAPLEIPIKTSKQLSAICILLFISETLQSFFFFLMMPSLWNFYSSREGLCCLFIWSHNMFQTVQQLLMRLGPNRKSCAKFHWGRYALQPFNSVWSVKIVIPAAAFPKQFIQCHTITNDTGGTVGTEREKWACK